MYAHVFITWFVANLLHPFIVLYFMNGHWDYEWEVIGTVMFVLIYSFIFSLPCLAAAMLSIWIIDNIPFNILGKYILWLMIATVLPFFLVKLLFGNAPWEEFKELALPAMIATAATIIIRVKYFFEVFALREAKNQEGSLNNF